MFVFNISIGESIAALLNNYQQAAVYCPECPAFLAIYVHNRKIHFHRNIHRLLPKRGHILNSARYFIQLM